MYRLLRAVRGNRRTLVLVTVLVGLVGLVVPLVHSTAASAQYRPGARVANPLGLFTEVKITGTGVGRTVAGAVAPAGLDVHAGYPAAPPAGSVAHSGYAGTIAITDPDGRTGLSYCIDLETETETGVHYHHGDWTGANVPNLGYVEYILLNYYPKTGEPAALTATDRAAAVQAAIWFFTDRFVLNAGNPTAAVRTQASAIVDAALAHGPSAEPDFPVLNTTPASLRAPATGQIVGPFTVTADGPSTITLHGVEVFTDPAGSHPLASGDEVRPGERLWARSVSGSSPQGFVLERAVTQPTGTAYLYDGSNPGFDEAQKLILAQNKELRETAGALLEPFAAGRLRVTKHITGLSAGAQGEITVKVACEGPAGFTAQEHVLTFPAGLPAGEHSQEVAGLPAGSECEVTEVSDGSNGEAGLTAQPVVSPSSVTITADETAGISVVDDYCVPRQPEPTPTVTPTVTPTSGPTSGPTSEPVPGCGTEVPVTG